VRRLDEEELQDAFADDLAEDATTVVGRDADDVAVRRGLVCRTEWIRRLVVR
jgi:hypothetical protein